jgi:hypothetical protein
MHQEHQEQERDHGHPLPSFLFQILADRNIDPGKVDLVVDNAAACPHPSMKETFSAPCLYCNHRGPPPSSGTPLSFDNGRRSSASLLPSQKTNPKFANGTARWAPIVGSWQSPRSSRSSVSIQSETIKALLRKASSKREKQQDMTPLTPTNSSRSSSSSKKYKQTPSSLRKPNALSNLDPSKLLGTTTEPAPDVGSTTSTINRLVSSVDSLLIQPSRHKSSGSLAPASLLTLPPPPLLPSQEQKEDSSLVLPTIREGRQLVNKGLKKNSSKGGAGGGSSTPPRSFNYKIKRAEIEESMDVAQHLRRSHSLEDVEVVPTKKKNNGGILT